MKIQSLTGTIGYTGTVREKQEEGANWQQHSKDKDGKNKDSHSKDNKDKQSTSHDYSDSNFPNSVQDLADEEQAAALVAEKMNLALESFKADAQAQSNGLVANVIGSGPGLKVVLKDGSGSVVKQFSGEEFVRLRSGTQKDQHSPGKILDRKL